ncbi:MAG TPA: hypothetical protein VGX23_17260 [Actinocrinis sp.]|nr:hypothetical protein [Actinocrinis sp.]
MLEGFAGRRSTLPFALVVMTVLGAGLVSVLVLNTVIDHGAFRLQQSQQRQTDLTNQEQQLQQQVAGLSAPGPLASQAARLGMVPNQQPVFLDPSAGTVLGTPIVATSPPPPPATPPPTAAPPATAAPTGAPGATGAIGAVPGANAVPGATVAPVLPGAATTAPAAAAVPTTPPAPPSASPPAAAPDPAGSPR